VHTFCSQLVRPFYTVVVILLSFSILPVPVAARPSPNPRAGFYPESAPAVELQPFDGEKQPSAMPAIADIRTDLRSLPGETPARAGLASQVLKPVSLAPESSDRIPLLDLSPLVVRVNDVVTGSQPG
jgi:hypothetical protein